MGTRTNEKSPIMQIDFVGSNFYTYREAVEIVPRIWRTAKPFLGQPTAIRCQGRTKLGNAIKSYFVNHVESVYDAYCEHPGDALVFIARRSSDRLRRPKTMFDVPTLSICAWTGMILDAINISATKFCQVYGWKEGDVLENPEHKTVLRINQIKKDKVIGQRANEYAEKFGDEMEIFPNERYIRIGNTQEILGR